MVKSNNVRIISSIDSLCSDSTIDGNGLAVADGPIVLTLIIIRDPFYNWPFVIIQNFVDKLSNNADSLIFRRSIVRACCTTDSDGVNVIKMIKDDIR